MTEITASLVVDFRDPSETGPDGATPDAALIARIDNREDGLNGGRSTIRPGDPVHYLIHKTNNVTIDEQITTAGAISPAGAGLIAVDEYLTFADSDEQTLQLPIAGGLSVAWQGADGGPVAQASQIRLRLQQKTVGVLRVQYQTSFQAFVLRNVPATITRVLIFLRGQHG